MKAKDLKIDNTINIADFNWSKFTEDKNGNAYMLCDKTIADMDFGDNNNWKESKIREMLNTEIYEKIIEELGKEAIVPFKVDLLSLDGLDDYGNCEDKVSILTIDLYRNNRKNIKKINSYYWLSSPNSTPSGCGPGYVRCVDFDGGVGCYWCGSVSGFSGVRPFFVLNKDYEIF